MNKHFYRIIFNKARGILMVVAEIVKRHQGEGRSSQKAAASGDKKITATLKPISFLTLVALGFVSVIAQSQASTIRVDSSADKSQQASVIDRAGPAIINIQEASSAGVSHNKYTQFDVSKEGVILNNSAQQSNTQLAGNIAGNSNLANSGGAKIILNEINSQNASQLNGMIEVAGQKAQVIIANAAGITCNGCGFINADRATLTTGKAIMENGELKGYQVEQGEITMNGYNYDWSYDANGGPIHYNTEDYTDLIARAVKLNKSMLVKNLTIIAGKNKVSHDLQTVEKLNSNDAKPEFSIDTAYFSGMYANKIKLVSTEGGVGVRNARGSEFNITAEGKIVTDGEIEDFDNVNFYSKDDIEMKGFFYHNNISLISEKSVYVKKQYEPDTGGFYSTEFNNKGSIHAGGDVYNEAQMFIDSIIAEGKIINNQNMRGKVIIGKQGIYNNETGWLSLTNGNLVSEQVIINAGEIASDSITIKAPEIINTGEINAPNWYKFEKDEDGNLLKDENGHLIRHDYTTDLNIAVDGKFTNIGRIVSKKNLNLSNSGVINNKGTMIGNDINLVSKQTINNDGHISAANNLTLHAVDVNNSNQLTAKGNLTIASTGKMTNSAGNITAKNINLAINTLNNNDHGEIHSAGVFNIGGRLDKNGNVTGKAGTINNTSATLSAYGDLTINAAQINNKVKTTDVLIKNEHVEDWGIKNESSKRYSTDEAFVYGIKGSKVLYLKVRATGKKTSDFYHYDYNKKTYEIKADSQVAKISSGGNLTVSANNIINENSQIDARKGLLIKGNYQNKTIYYYEKLRVIKSGKSYHVYDKDGIHYKDINDKYYVNFIQNR